MKKIVVTFFGVLLIAIGIVGLFLPILQGWAMIFMGLALVSPSLARKVKGRVLRRLFKKDIILLNEWKKDGVQAGFTTRHFPLVLKKTDELLEPEAQKKFTALLKRNKFALLNQVHGGGIAVIETPEKYEKDGFYHFPGCDGALTNVPEMTLLVFSADCLPIFMAAGSWVGLVHAGWKGSRERIAEKAFKILLEKSGAGPRDAKIFFGPSISAKCYEVGPEFMEHFSKPSFFEKNGKMYFDLVKENERQLLGQGAKEENISGLGICTFTEKEDFYSYRREKDGAGRLISFISRS